MKKAKQIIEYDSIRPEIQSKTPRQAAGHIGMVSLTRFLVFPAAVYLALFIYLTYPLIFQFHTHFFADKGDGLQNVWNIWWINKAVTELHQNPWYTTYLYYPSGTTLLGQTLNPFNGFIAIPLLKIFSLIETHNIIVIFSFVIGGVTTFWLSYSITGSYWSSIIAGYIFTFSQYHFMHAEGHLQLVSLEWIPLFVLCWYRFINKPGLATAILSGIVLFGVLLCDYYYFLYCVLAGCLMILWSGITRKDLFFFLRKECLFYSSIFFIVVLLTSGLLIFSLLWTNSNDALLGAHDPFDNSLDLFAPFIPGPHWRFASLTEFYWSNVRGHNINEESVYVGLLAIFLIGYVFINRRKAYDTATSINLWYLLLIFFAIMALGPALNVAGRELYSGVMPYSILQALIPPLKLSGCPVRMMVMVMLSAAVISAIGLKILFKQHRAKRILLGGILGVILLVDFLPKPLPASNIDIPEYIHQLKNMPNKGGVIDGINSPTVALYYQTIYEKPMVGGYISRTPTSAAIEENAIAQACRNRDTLTLSNKYNIKYILISYNNKDVILTLQ